MRGLFISVAALVAVAATTVLAATSLAPAWTHIGQFGSPGVFETLGASAILAGPRTLDRVDLATGADTLLNNGGFNGQPSFNTAKTTMLIPVFAHDFKAGLALFDVATGNNVSSVVRAPCDNVCFTYYDGVYVGLCASFGATLLVGVSGDTAAIAWQVSLPRAVPSRIALDRAAGLVFAVNLNQTIFALDARTGSTKWSTSLRSEATQQPALCGGRLLVSTLRSIVALDPASGAILWSRAAEWEALALVPPVCAARPSGAPFVVVTTPQGQLSAYDVMKGVLLFQTNQTTVGGSNTVSPLYSPQHGLLLTFGKSIQKPEVVIGVVNTAGSFQGQFSVQVSAVCQLGMNTIVAEASQRTLRVLFSCKNFFAIDIPLR